MKYFLSLSILMVTAFAFSQQHNNEFYNDGAVVTVQNGANMYVMGDFHNYETTGLLNNNGFIEIQGHALSDNLFEQRGTGTVLMINNDVNAGETQFISGSYAVRGGQAAIGVNDGSFYNLQLANDQGIVWLNGAGNIADVRNSVDFNGPGAPVVNRIITHDPTAIPGNGSGYSATFGVMNASSGLLTMLNNTVTSNGNMSGTDNGYVQGNFRRAIAAAGGTYEYVLGLEPAGAGAQRGMQYMLMNIGANNYDVISGYFQTGLDNTFPAAVECSGYIIDYWGGVDDGQWVMNDITGAGAGSYEVRVWPQDDNFPAKSVWLVTKDNSVQGTTDDCGPTVVGLDRAAFNGMGQFGVAASDILLPAELLNIWADPKLDHIQVGWNVGSEYNLDYYNVQRSTDGINFETIGQVQAVGNSNSELSYAFDDTHVSRNITYYYRFVSVDFDFYTENSPIVSAKLGADPNGMTEESVLVYPNPTNGNVSLEISLNESTSLLMKVYNGMGQIVQSEQLLGLSGNNIFVVQSLNWSPGMYVLEIFDAQSGKTIRKKLIKE